VGRKQFNSGDVWVLGGKPGSKGSGVPGPRIGYMPQVCVNIERNIGHLVVNCPVGECGRIRPLSSTCNPTLPTLSDVKI
jgi:hypothetical protein